MESIALKNNKAQQLFTFHSSLFTSLLYLCTREKEISLDFDVFCHHRDDGGGAIVFLPKGLIGTQGD